MNCDIIYDTIYVTNLCRYTENNAKILFLPTLACKHVISCNQNIVRLLDFDPGLISIMSNPKKTRLQKKKKERKWKKNIQKITMRLLIHYIIHRYSFQLFFKIKHKMPIVHIAHTSPLEVLIPRRK